MDMQVLREGAFFEPYSQGLFRQSSSSGDGFAIFVADGTVDQVHYRLFLPVAAHNC